MKTYKLGKTWKANFLTDRPYFTVIKKAVTKYGYLVHIHNSYIDAINHVKIYVYEDGSVRAKVKAMRNNSPIPEIKRILTKYATYYYAPKSGREIISHSGENTREELSIWKGLKAKHNK